MELKVGRLYEWTVPFRPESSGAVTVRLQKDLGNTVFVEYNGEVYPARTQDLTDTPQFEPGDTVRYGQGWSHSLYEVQKITHTSSSDETLYYVCPLDVDENGDIGSVNAAQELRSESDLVAVKHYHVFGLYGDDMARWHRSLWAKDAQEAGVECQNGTNGELEVAVVLLVNGSIEVQE
jgi:hypothetical protein